MRYYNKKICILLGVVIIILVFFLTNGFHLYKVEKKMNTPIIGFDIMKLSRDKVGNQPSKLLIDNILTIVKQNFPGTTHIAISTPEDSNADFIAHGVNPKPLTVEAFIDMQLDEIHTAGYGAVIRSFPSSIQKAYNFPLVAKTSDQWVAYNKAFLETHASHIKSGDIIALWYELDWWQRDFGVSINDTGHLVNDTNTFIVKNAQMVDAFAKEHNLILRCRTTYSDVPFNYWTDAVAQAQGNVLVFDHYRPTSQNISLNLTDTQIIAQQISDYNTIFKSYGSKYMIYVQEWGDNRKSADGSDGGIQINDPGFSGMMADQVAFPLLKSGILEGWDFWDLFDTPKEGILTIIGNTAILNPKGVALAKVFQKWYGGVVPTPQPTPPPTTVVPAFNMTKNAKIAYDGNGNLTITLQ